MKWENGKEYHLKAANCDVVVVLDNFSDAVADKFNRMIADAKIKAYYKEVDNAEYSIPRTA